MVTIIFSHPNPLLTAEELDGFYNGEAIDPLESVDTKFVIY